MRAAIPIQPTLAHAWNPDKTDPRGWFMSEKLDGVRCIYKDGMFFTRTGKTINAPKFFTKYLTKNKVILDGEIYGGYGNFDKTSGICRKKKAVAADWKTLTYQIFDVVDYRDCKACERQEIIKSVIGRSKYHKIVKQRICRGAADVAEFLKEVEARGGEGVMLRDTQAVYEFKRSHSLLKVKTFKDLDARVVEHKKGSGKYKRKLGAVVCEMSDGKRFKCGSGFTDAQRESPPSIGTLITVKYFELTKAKIPRFPSYVGVRAEQDLS
jgi:DNA ligase-1